MEKQQLTDVVIEQLEAIKKHKGKEVDISEDTVLSEVLSTTDGKGSSNSKNVFRIAVGWTLLMQKIKTRWPRGWEDLSVRDFVSKFVILIFLLVSINSFSQVQVTLGASKTELKNNAITIGLSYLQSFDSVLNNEHLIVGKRSGFLITPEMNIQAGTEDAFSAIEIKASGLLMTFKTKTVSGILTPDLTKTFHTFPINLGVETNSGFNFVNGILEVGYVPWFMAGSKSVSEIINHSKFGFYLQGGYKFKIDTSGSKPVGGEIDQSQEDLKSSILRAKGEFGIDTKPILNVNGLRVSILGDAKVWYDFINGVFYHKLDGRARFHLTNTNSLDFIYQKGAGAPTFNEGDMWGVGLTVTL